MPCILKSVRVTFALLAVCALSACANLAAVRDFTKQSASLAGYTGTTNFMVSNPDRLLREAPASEAFLPVRNGLTADRDARAKARDSLLKIHAVVAGYMAALAELAGEKAFSVSSGIGKVQGALDASTTFGITPATVDAYAAILTKVTDWLAEAAQEKEVKAMVNKHGDAMDTLLAGLVDVSTTMAAILEQDQQKLLSFNEYYEGGFKFDLGPEQPPPANLGASDRARQQDQMNTARLRREAARIMVQRSNAASAAEQQAALDSAKAALAGAVSVQQGHAEMRKSVERLTGEKLTAVLQQLAADLKDVQAELKKL